MNANQLTLDRAFDWADRDLRAACRQQADEQMLAGMAQAAAAKQNQIMAAQVALLESLPASGNGTATLDDATADLSHQFPDGGKWRGPAVRALALAGIMQSAGAVKSDRPSRHRGFVTLWRLVDPLAAQQLLSRLRASQQTAEGA